MTRRSGQRPSQSKRPSTPAGKPRSGAFRSPPPHGARRHLPETIREPRKALAALNPFDAAVARRAVQHAFRRLLPRITTLPLEPVDVLQLVQHADLCATVPLRSGTFRMGPLTLEIPAETTARIHVAIHDGRPVAERGGCTLDFSQPVTLPLGQRLRGVAWEAAGDGATLSMHLEDQRGPDLRTLLQASGIGKDRRARRLAWDVIDLASVDVEGVITLRQGRLAAGPVSASIDADSELHLKIRGGAMGVAGQLRLSRVTLADARGAVELQDLDVELDGQRQARGVIEASITRLKSELHDLRMTSEAGDEHVTAAAGHVEGEGLTLRVHRGVPSVRGQLRLSLHEADVALAPRGRDFRADLAAHVQQLDVDLGLSDGEPEVDAWIHHGRLSVDTLHSEHAGARINVPSFHAEIDGHFQAAHQQLTADLHVESISGEVQELRVERGPLRLRAGMKLSGGGTLSGRGGLRFNGALRADAEVREAKLSADGRPWAELSDGARLHATLGTLSVDRETGVELRGEVAGDASLTSARLRLPRIQARGDARISGRWAASLAGGKVTLKSTDATLTSVLARAKLTVGDQATVVAQPGSRLVFPVEELRWSFRNHEGNARLRDGSLIELVVRRGEITLADRRFRLVPLSTARVELRSLEFGKEGAGELRGRVEAELAAVETVAPATEKRVAANAVQLEAHTRLTCDDFLLQRDGTLVLNALHVGVNAAGEPPGANAERLLETMPRGGAPAAATSAPFSGIAPDGRVKSDATLVASAEQGHIKDQDPLKFVTLLKEGVLDAEIPIQGKIGHQWFESIEFTPGTRLVSHARIHAGRIVPDELWARFTIEGDAPLWVTARGLYMDDARNLRMDLGGMKDLPAPGLTDMPLEVPEFINRMVFSGIASTPNLLHVVKVDDVRFTLKDACIAGGRVKLGEGWIDVDGQSRFSVEGTRRAVTIMGTLQLGAVNLVHAGGVLSGGPGHADLRMTYRNMGGTGVIQAVLTQFSLEGAGVSPSTASVVGAIRDAALAIHAAVTLDARGFPVDVVPSDIELSVGEVRVRLGERG